MNCNKIFADAYDQASAYGEWHLFTKLSFIAPKGNYHAGRQAAYWLREVARLEVRMPI